MTVLFVCAFEIEEGGAGNLPFSPLPFSECKVVVFKSSAILSLVDTTTGS